MLERGGYLPRSRANWDAKTVFVDGTYQAPDTWCGKDGKSFHPGLHYYVGQRVAWIALNNFRKLAQTVNGIWPRMA